MTEKLVLEDFDDPHFDAFSVEENAFSDTPDPYELIAEKAKENWLHPIQYRTWFTNVVDQGLGGFPHYTVLGYDKVNYVLTNPEIFGNDAFLHSLGRSFGRTISAMNPPEHSRYRRIFQKAFLPNVVKEWGDTVVQPVVDNLLDKVIPEGKADLYEGFTRHYPFQVIYRQLDLPAEDITTFHRLAITQTLHTIDLAKAIEAGQKLGVYFQKLLEIRRENPGDDIVSMLGQVEVDGEYLPDDVVVSFLRQLINAGGDTTYRGTSVLFTELFKNQEQLDAVRNDRSLIPQAIQEALRFDGPVLVTRRWVRKDVEIGGQLLKEGSVVDVVLGSANRDPNRFENPNKFDIFRDMSVRPVPFASGPHVCIGQHLAKVEMERALNAVFDKLPNVRLDPDMPRPELRGFSMRVPKHIHVVFGDA